jgi:hypothetical protein
MKYLQVTPKPLFSRLSRTYRARHILSEGVVHCVETVAVSRLRFAAVARFVDPGIHSKDLLNTSHLGDWCFSLSMDRRREQSVIFYPYGQARANGLI